MKLASWVTLLGTGAGWLIGSLQRSDVWAPLPDRRMAPGIAAIE
ncbi:MAG TPA: hypothetical protein VFZ87_12100 [Gemmatimonadales bacterium]